MRTQSSSREERRRSNGRPRGLRRAAALVATIFTWTFILAVPVSALTHVNHALVAAARKLTAKEMDKDVGRYTLGIPMKIGGGTGFKWVSTVGGVNTGTGNKQIAVPIVGWTARGGMPVDFTLYFNSLSPYSGELGNKWSH